jgi:hypothetical protein
MSMPWHIGIAVPDLKEGLDEFSDLFGIEWRPVREIPVRLTDEHNRAHDVIVKVTFSLTNPFSIELWESLPGTPLGAPEGTNVHHLGYWTDDFEGEQRRLNKLGYPAFMTATGMVMHRGPGGLGIEPENVHTDIPSLRDLFPADSPFVGEPVF